MATKKTTASASPESARIIIPPMNMKTVQLTLVGETSLIVHKWSEKAKKEIRDSQSGVVKSRKKEARNPVGEFVDTLYFLDGSPAELTEEALQAYIANGGRIGFPTTAFKARAVMGPYRTGVDLKMTELKANMWIRDEYAEIKFNSIHMREDMVKIGGVQKTADLRYRASIDGWYATLLIDFNADMLSEDAIVNLFERGGKACGLGEWRNDRNGNFGTYHVQRDGEKLPC